MIAQLTIRNIFNDSETKATCKVNEGLSLYFMHRDAARILKVRNSI
jgi:hypothetical protein